MTSHSALPACQIEAFTLGMWATNCYLVYYGDPGRPAAADCWIVDASFEPEPIAARISELSLSPRALILTHAHIDHIAGVNQLMSAFAPRGCRLMIHENEEAWLTDPMLNLSMAAGMPVTARKADQLLHDGDTLSLGADTWRILHTPGHSPGSISLYSEHAGAALVGDALFAGSIGRTDFPGCDFDTLAHSIRTKLYTLPERTAVHPGHGPATTIGREKSGNPFVRG
jgi:hydroxyacylglutathione hydrolase